MARKLLMGDLVRRSLRRADLEGSSPFTPPEVKALISEQYGKLYAVVAKAGFRYFEASSSITANGSTSYPLPDDHDFMIGVDRIVDAANGITVQLGELMVQERNYYSGAIGDACAFSVVGQNVVLFPRPVTGEYTLLYVPQSPDISTLADSAEVDLVTADGEAFLIWAVAVPLLAKVEASTDLAIVERNDAERRFAEDVGLRALHNPRRRVVMRAPISDDDWWDDY